MAHLRSLCALAATALVLSTSASAQHPENLNASPAPLSARSASSAVEAAVTSATIDDDIFLQGTFIGLGISGAGSFGTDNPAPAGFLAPRRQLGYVFDNDGIGVGDDPLTGDFFLPGSPEEGFAVGYLTEEGNLGTANVFTNVERNSLVEVTPVSVTDLTSGSQLAAEFVGLTQDGVLGVTQTVSFDEDDRRVAVVITLTNEGDAPIYDARYIRNVDPDQDLDTRGTYTTTNTVVANFPDDLRAVVRANGLETGEPFFYVSTDDRLRVSRGGFSTPSPYVAFVYDSPSATGFTNVSDEAITITGDVGALAPGASATFQFFLGFDDDIESDPLLTLSAAPLSIPETGVSTITATLSEPSDEDVVVTLAFSGTAGGDDYSVPTTITIPVGETSASVDLTAVDDADVDAETVVIDVASTTNSIEQGEQQVTITILAGDAPSPTCSDEVALAFGDFDTDGNDATYGEFAEVLNGSDDVVDLSTCSFATFDPYTETVIYTAQATGVVEASSSYVFATTGGDQALPPASIADGPGAIVLFEGTATVGASVGDVLGDVVAAVVYVDEDDVYAAVSGGGTAESREAQRRAFLTALASLASPVDAEDGADGVDLAVTAAPNPARGRTTVSFGVAEAADVRVAVYDALGRQVAVLADAPLGAGRHDVALETARLPAGVYVVRAVVGAEARTARLTVVR